MKATELIKMLESAVKAHGDLDVVHHDKAYDLDDIGVSYLTQVSIALVVNDLENGAMLADECDKNWEKSLLIR